MGTVEAKPKPTLKPLMIRVPEDLLWWIKDKAHRERVSVRKLLTPILVRETGYGGADQSTQAS